MGSQMSIATGVIGVLLVLFLAILYSRFGGEQPPLNIPVPTPVPVQAGESNVKQGKRPTIVIDSPNTVPPEAFNPVPVPTPDVGHKPPTGPAPEALLPSEGLLTPAEFEARRQMQWPLPSPLENRGLLSPPSLR